MKQVRRGWGGVLHNDPELGRNELNRTHEIQRGVSLRKRQNQHHTEQETLCAVYTRHGTSDSLEAAHSGVLHEVVRERNKHLRGVFLQPSVRGEFRHGPFRNRSHQVEGVERPSLSNIVWGKRRGGNISPSRDAAKSGKSEQIPAKKLPIIISNYNQPAVSCCCSTRVF